MAAVIFMTFGQSSCARADVDLAGALMKGLREAVLSAEQQPEEVDRIRAWLKEDMSYRVNARFMNLAINGMEHEIVQETGRDGSFHFVSRFKMWNHQADWEDEEKAEYYYRYEGDELACYMRIDDGELSRGAFAAEEAESFLEMRDLMAGQQALLPYGVEDFARSDLPAPEGQTAYTYGIPLSRIRSGGTMIASFLDNAFALAGKEMASEEGVSVQCTMLVDEESLQPVSVSFTFDELKPRLLSAGALSGEYALDVDLMTLEYEFDYRIPDQIEIPEAFMQ